MSNLAGPAELKLHDLPNSKTHVNHLTLKGELTQCGCETWRRFVQKKEMSCAQSFFFHSRITVYNNSTEEGCYLRESDLDVFNWMTLGQLLSSLFGITAHF